MGQEFGHAYEDLLDLALQRILPVLSSDARTFRVSPQRQMNGVSGNIDHLIEVASDGITWIPYALFMEKHSDSADESHKHLRRHLEEYVQAKVSSIINFGYSTDKSLLVINLIYGNQGGWKKKIITESKALLFPTLYLVEEAFYDGIDGMIREAIQSSKRPYRRDEIRAVLSMLASTSQAFEDFVSRIFQTLQKPPEAPIEQEQWLKREIERSVSCQSITIPEPNPIYARRGFTELLVLQQDVQRKVLESLSTRTPMSTKRGLTEDDVRALQVISPGSDLIPELRTKTDAPSYRFDPSYTLKSLQGISTIKDMVVATDRVFLNPGNPLQMQSCDYLAYFDIRDDRFIDSIGNACKSTLGALDGDTIALQTLIAEECVECNTVAQRGVRSCTRMQNLNLEAVMALASYIASQMAATRTDLSTSTLARLSGISESVVNTARSGGIRRSDIAQNLVAGVMRFYGEFGKYLQRCKTLISEQLALLETWRLWTPKGSEPPILPAVVNPQQVMSLAWFRLNQLNSHSIFNPLSAVVYEWARAQTDASYKVFGFPAKRSANPINIVLGDEYEGADYEYTTVFWNHDKRSIRVFETSSVINFKHTSDKCKELCAKIRVVKAAISRDCEPKFWLMVDGDWSVDHIRDLFMAGWDDVVYSRDYFLSRTALAQTGEK